ncbi:hypothetical protein HDU87_006520 [Geranomyces variabilis]|uniref:Uncharacterized protein n=1 Tax=Geranomyces variabilis TaxID=109894 RepID=A0AAD5TFT8_9FUNG|nr:hypothetical protein HDU87_006520 [Geranomyces variabilis]
MDDTAAKQQLISISREADIDTRKQRFGSFLVKACREANETNICLLIEQWWNPFHTKIVDNMIECMQLYVDRQEEGNAAADVDPELDRVYLVDIEDRYNESMEMDDLLVKEALVDVEE